jgi:hypothetical protein
VATGSLPTAPTDERQFVVNLSPDHPAITEDDLTSADCHDIPAP